MNASLQEVVLEAIYLPKNLKIGKIKPIRTSLLIGLAETKFIEQKLLAVKYRNPQGDSEIWKENNEKWFEVLVPFLVDKYTARFITRGAK